MLRRSESSVEMDEFMNGTEQSRMFVFLVHTGLKAFGFTFVACSFMLRATSYCCYKQKTPRELQFSSKIFNLSVDKIANSAQ